METTDHPNLPERAPERSPCDWRPARNNLTPVSRGEAIALLSACLSLVRPVGMATEEAADWLAVAAGSVDYLPIDLLDGACLEARRTCTHHSQIVPTVIAAAQPRFEERQRLASIPEWAPSRALPAPEPLPPPPPMTQADIDALPHHLVKLGLTAGFLTKDDTGKVILAPELP